MTDETDELLEPATAFVPAFAERKRFHIGDVLSVAIGCCVSLRGWEGPRDVEEYMAGRPLSLGDRLRYFGVFGPEIVRQHPNMVFAFADDVPTEEFLVPWLDRYAFNFGWFVEVARFPADHPVRCRPIAGPAASAVRRSNAAAPFESPSLSLSGPVQGGST